MALKIICVSREKKTKGTEQREKLRIRGPYPMLTLKNTNVLKKIAVHSFLF